MKDQFAVGLGLRNATENLGCVRHIAVSPETLEAVWLVIDVADSTHVTAVPTRSASVDSRGTVRVPFTRQQLLDAPEVRTAITNDDAVVLRTALGLE